MPPGARGPAAASRLSTHANRARLLEFRMTFIIRARDFQDF